MKSYKFRIYPSKAQEKEMRTHLWLSKELWNEMLSFTKEIYNNYKKFPTKRALREFVKNSGLYSQVGQELVDRLSDALHKKIQMKKKGERGGFPRFKNIDRMKSLNYPQSGFSLDNKLRITPFGKINIVKHREINGKIKSMTIKRESSGKWFAVFCVETKIEPKTNNGEKIGLDLGIKNIAALSNGTIIENPKQLKRYEDNLAFLQKRLSRKKKGSNNRKKAKFKVATIHEKIANTRADFLHKLSHDFVNKYSMIAIEDLKVSNMVRNRHLSKSISDVSWSSFINMLAYKAEEAGCQIVFVNPNNTTKACSGCGNIQDMPLSERIYYCPKCGMIKDRDVNAAINILNRAITAGQVGINACGDEIKISSEKQEAHTL